jgi:hypothetical protein
MFGRATYMDVELSLVYYAGARLDQSRSRAWFVCRPLPILQRFRGVKSSLFPDGLGRGMQPLLGSRSQAINERESAWIARICGLDKFREIYTERYFDRRMALSDGKGMAKGLNDGSWDGKGTRGGITVTLRLRLRLSRDLLGGSRNRQITGSPYGTTVRPGYGITRTEIGCSPQVLCGTVRRLGMAVSMHTVTMPFFRAAPHKSHHSHGVGCPTPWRLIFLGCGCTIHSAIPWLRFH